MSKPAVAVTMGIPRISPEVVAAPSPTGGAQGPVAMAIAIHASCF